MRMLVSPAETVWNLTCSCVQCSDRHYEEITVARNTSSVVEKNESIGKRTRSGLDWASYAPTAFEFAEAFGGGSEYFPFSRLRLWPFTLIRLFKQEEE